MPSASPKAPERASDEHTTHTTISRNTYADRTSRRPHPPKAVERKPRSTSLGDLSVHCGSRQEPAVHTRRNCSQGGIFAKACAHKHGFAGLSPVFRLKLRAFCRSPVTSGTTRWLRPAGVFSLSSIGDQVRPARLPRPSLAGGSVPPLPFHPWVPWAGVTRQSVLQAPVSEAADSSRNP